MVPAPASPAAGVSSSEEKVSSVSSEEKSSPEISSGFSSSTDSSADSSPERSTSVPSSAFYVFSASVSTEASTAASSLKSLACTGNTILVPVRVTARSQLNAL